MAGWVRLPLRYATEIRRLTSGRNLTAAMPGIDWRNRKPATTDTDRPSATIADRISKPRQFALMLGSYPSLRHRPTTKSAKLLRAESSAHRSLRKSLIDTYRRWARGCLAGNTAYNASSNKGTLSMLRRLFLGIEVRSSMNARSQCHELKDVKASAGS